MGFVVVAHWCVSPKLRTPSTYKGPPYLRRFKGEGGFPGPIVAARQSPSFFFLRYQSGPIHGCSNFLHAFGDALRQFHHLLAQCPVFLNLAFNTFAVGLQLSSQPLKLTNETLISPADLFVTRSFALAANPPRLARTRAHARARNH